MKPTKIIVRRDPSAIATCTRSLNFTLQGVGGSLPCGALMQLVVTRSPLSNEPWEFLLVERCLAGHLAHVQGVLQEEQQT